ncbi:MAG: SpoIIE family protein phosphatase [Calditrichae bacterium]|nr:SpoIIE family protein phosphatase [Calditrichota bacterium]MCB9058328.1 SpoIIE family protein phosphatase [Calditrichia bacterium]
MNISVLKSTKFITIFSIWFVSCILLLQSDQLSVVITQIAFFAIIFSWFALNRFFSDELKPNIEIVVFGFIVFQMLDLQLLSFFDAEILTRDISYFIRLLHDIILALEIVTLGYLLVYNNKNKQRIIPAYIFIAIICHYIVYPEGEIAQIILYVLLFFILLKRTYWIEFLPKNSLGIYFVFFGGLLFLLSSKAPFGSFIVENFDADISWLTTPKFLFDILFIYVIALMVKIPAVLIYNHMSLSRKLWFAGLFQSGIPQIFQLALLILLFYFFVAGWQAGQLKDSLLKLRNNTSQKIENIDTAHLSATEGIFKKTSNEQTNNPLFYYFWKDSVGSNDYHLIEIDSHFCRNMLEGSQHIFGNGIQAYPFNSASWQQKIDAWDFWQKKSSVKIYPFSFTSNAEDQLAEYFIKPDSNHREDAVFLLDLPGGGVSVGRLIIPVYDSQGKIISDFSIDMALNYSAFDFSDPMVGMVFALLMVFTLSNMFIIRRVAQAGDKINKTIVEKFDLLKKGIREISDGNLQFKLTMAGEDEFVELARRFNQMGTRLQETIKEAREKDRLDQELAIARDVQLSLLPAMLPDIKGYEIAATLVTAQEVSGDFYDIIAFDDQHFLFTIGDVSGKGTSAAFYMAQFISLFRYSAQFTKFPREIAVRINEYFTRHVQDRQVFITAIIGVLNVNNGQITYIRAGHNNPYLLSLDKDSAELDSKGIGIGLTKNSDMLKNTLEKVDLTLKPGEQLVLYTDGLVEATRVINQQDDQFGEDKLEKILNKYKNDSPFKILNEITSAVNSFYNGQPYKDDLTVMIIRKTD